MAGRMGLPLDREKLVEVLFSANGARLIGRSRIMEELPMALEILGNWSEEDRSRRVEELEDRLDALLLRPSRRLAAYGSLRPGQANHGLVAHLRGTWLRGSVRGDLHPTGWGAVRGFPALIHNEDGPAVPVDVLDSDELPAHWQRLDDFEGADYTRLLVPVDLEDGRRIVANLYHANPERWRR